MLIYKISGRQRGRIGRLHQDGTSLVEILVGLALSMTVITAMTALMSNSLGATSRIIQMSNLTDELRTTMSILSRDVRRANYNPLSIYCYANSDCGITDSATAVSADLDVVSYLGNSCLRYFLEREAPTGSPGAIGGGAVRHVVSGGVGWLEMWVGGDQEPPDSNCGGDANRWVPITDSSVVDITVFAVDDDTGSISATLAAQSSTLTQRTRQVHIQIQGRLIRDNSITRHIEDTIKVRNDFITTTST